MDSVGRRNWPMATLETAWRKTDGPARYHGGDVAVELGDRIEYRGIFRKRRGVVNYVPGISAAHPEMEHGGLHWAGIAFDNGTFTGVLVDPDTGCTLKRLILLSRGERSAIPPLPQDEEW